MTTRLPAVRAAAVKDTLDFLDVFQPGARAAVLACVPPASREIIRSTPRSSWVGIEHDHYTIDGMIELFGRDRAIQCWRDALANLVDRPLLGAFVTGMTRLFGKTPARVVSLFPKGWPLVYHDMCTVRLDQTVRGDPVLHFEDVAPEVRRFSNYFHSWHGACQGFAHIAHVEGRVDFEVAPDKTRASATFFWS